MELLNCMNLSQKLSLNLLEGNKNENQLFFLSFTLVNLTIKQLKKLIFIDLYYLSLY